MNQLRELIHAFAEQHSESKDRNLTLTRMAIQQMLGENSNTDAVVAIQVQMKELSSSEINLLAAMVGALTLEPNANNSNIQAFLQVLATYDPDSLVSRNAIY